MTSSAEKDVPDAEEGFEMGVEVDPDYFAENDASQIRVCSTPGHTHSAALHAEKDALVESLVAVFYERYPTIADREDIGESDLRETMRAGLARAFPPGGSNA